MKIFLGGTCNGSTWRDGLTPLLGRHKFDYFNPVVEDWTPACQEEEYRQKKICNVHLYVITKEMTGVFSIAEAVDSVHTDNVNCIFQVFPDGFTIPQLKSLKATCDLIHKRGGFSYVGEGLDFVIDCMDCIDRLK